MISPGALDMCGLFITPREQDFNALTSEKAQAILQEVTLSPEALKPIIAQLTDKPEEFKNKDTKETIEEQMSTEKEVKKARKPRAKKAASEEKVEETVQEETSNESAEA